MKSIKRIPAMLLVVIISFSVLIVGAQGLYAYSTVDDFGYMVPANYNFSKTLSTVYLYGNYDYINFSINSKDYGTYFFYEIYSDKDYTDLVNSDYTYCDDIGKQTFSPYVNLSGLYKTGTYYCVTYAAIIYSDGDICISEPSLRRFKIVVNRLPKYSQQVIGLNSVINTVDGPLVKWYALPSSVKYNIYRRPLVGTKWEKIGTVNGSTYEFTDKSVKNKNGRYVYTVRGVDKNGTLTRYHYSGVTAHYAKTPVVSSVSTVSDNLVQVKWNSTGSTAVYQIYRMENDGGWKLLKKDHKGTVFYDKTAQSGNKYRYTVRAVIRTNTGIALSHFYNGKTVTYIAAPELNPLEFTENGMNVTWKASKGAVKYAVYRKPLDENQNWRLIGKVDSKTTTFVDTTAVKEGNYLYTVRSEGANFQGSFISKGVEYFNLVPPDFKIEIKEGRINLTWDKAPYAKSYQVYVKINNGSWRNLGHTNTCDYSYTPSNLGEYNFAVLSVRNSKKSALKYNSENVMFFPTIPTGFIAYENYNRVYWNSTGAGSYNIYRKLANAPDTEYQLLGGTNNTYFSDTTAQYDVAYTYCVKGVYNSVEQHTNFNPVNFTKYAPEKYIKSFDGYKELFYYDDENYGSVRYSFNIEKTTAGQKMKPKLCVLLENGWRVVSNGSYYYNGDENTPKIVFDGVKRAFNLILGDENGQTPVDAVKVVVDEKMCPKPYFNLNVIGSGLNVTWDAVNGAVEYIIEESYDVKRIVNSNGSQTYSVTIPFSEFDNCEKMNLSVTAVHSNGNRTTNKITDFHIFSGIPKVSYVAKGENGNHVNWEKPQDNTWGGEYVLFRKEPGSSGWVKIASVPFNKRYYFDATAIPGIKYKYTVRVYDTTRSFYSSYYDTAGLEVGKLATPQLISAKNVSDGIVVNWHQNSCAVFYYVYRKSAGTGWVRISDVESTYFVDRTAKQGVTYYYTVRAYRHPVMSGYDSVGVKCKKS